MDDRFCGGCGAELAAACPTCGRVLVADAAFCTGCGTARAERQPTPTPGRNEDRRRVSVLFVDLIDFTPYVERADPELVREMQTGFFTAVRQVVGRYGGVVEKYIGDAVMALFGAPVATEADAVRCVRAGLELQRVLVQQASLSPADGAGPAGRAPTGLRFRVGVATGEALVDVSAARDGGQSIVAGDVVNTASRLQSVAPPGGVLVCGATHAATKATIRYQEQPPVTLRGRSTPTEVWLALEPLERTHPARDIDSTPMVNRNHELGLLLNALHRAVDDRKPQLVTVLGHAGIGKSRLVRGVYEYSQQLLDMPMVWRIGRCLPFGDNVTYAALAEIVKAQAGILDTDPAGTARQRLDTALSELVGTDQAARLSDALSPLVGLPGSTLSAEESESAWRRFVVALASRQPTVLVMEDLHWADESTLRFLELLAASVRDVPLLLLCTARPELVERNPTWAGTIAGSLTIPLPPLPDSDIATMYAHLLGPAAFPAELLDPLVEVADGNPLYAHEYTRMLIENGTLRPSGAQWSLESEDELPMPDSVHAVIANRVDLLDPVDRTVLQAAAVVGMQFWPGAVAAALGRPTDAIERSLRRLEQRDLISEQPASTMAGQPEYRFGHVLVRDVCYQRLPRTERVARHDRTADWLDGGLADRETDLAEVLAHHRYTAYRSARTLGLDASGYAPAARGALHRAARRAYALHALDTAAGRVALARSLFDDEPTDPAQTAELLRLELLAGEIAFYTDGEAFLAGDGEGLLAQLAERLYTAGEQGQAARAWTLLGQAAWVRADRCAALAYLDRAIELFEELPDTADKADAYAELGRLHMLNFEVAPAVAAAGAAAEIAERLGLVEVSAGARVTIGTARYSAGDRGGLAELHAVTDLCRNRRLLTLNRAVRNLSYALREEGDWTGSDALLTAGLPADVPGGHNLATGYSYDAMRAYFAGDWDSLVIAADAFLQTQGGEWDLQVRGLRAWIGALRTERPGNGSEAQSGRPGNGSAGEPGGPDEVDELVAAGRRSGFHRLEWTALGHGALCRVLQGRPGDATALLAELADSWRGVRAITSGEWLHAAAHAAALAGRSAAATIHEMLAAAPHRTPWVEAALRTAAGGVAAADGDPQRAAALHLAAADSYAAIPTVTDQMLALTAAVRALRAGGDGVADPWHTELVNFAARVKAPRLLELAGIVPA